MEFKNVFKKSVIYLDCNATTSLAEEVITGIGDSLVRDWGNPSSKNLHGAKAKAAISRARNQIAVMLNCSASEITFTSGGTEANNMVVNSVVQYYSEYEHFNKGKIKGKPHIITTNVEHDSVTLPIKHLEELSLVTSSIVKVNEKGCVNVEDVLSQIKDDTCLISVMYANNETGVIMPISVIGKELFHINSKREKMKKIRILFHTDAAQIIGKEKVNFETSNVDFMTIVGHKFYGPRIGCLCAKAKFYPLLYGGGQEKGLRPGTENTPMIVGLGIAAQLIADNIYKYTNHMLECREKLESGLKQVFGDAIVFNCGDSLRLPNTLNVSFREPGLEGTLVLSQCNRLIASVGAACHKGKCSKILINSGVPEELAKNAIRLSVGRDTDLRDVEGAILDLKAAIRELKQSQSVC